MNSSITLIQYGGRAPATPVENTAFHQDLIDTLSREARRACWDGCAVDSYRHREGYVSLAIVPGDAALDLEMLRAFRKQQRAEPPLPWCSGPSARSSAAAIRINRPALTAGPGRNRERIADA